MSEVISTNHNTTTTLSTMSDPLPLALYQDTAFTDVIIKCKDGKEIKAHKAVLAIRSPYFKALFSGKWAETCDCILETDANSVIMQHLLKCIYTGNKPILCNHTYTQQIHLWELSMYYQIPDLTAVMKECIEGITTENVIELLQVVERFPNKKGMKEGCFNFIGVHAKELLGNPAIVQFAASHPKMWKEVGAHMKNPNTTNLQCITEDLSLDEKSIKFPKLHKIKKMKKRK